LTVVGADLEALPSASLLTEGLATLELGARLFLALILFEAALSALTGLALFMTTLQPRPSPLPLAATALDDAEPGGAERERRHVAETSRAPSASRQRSS
jgi:hypothetical protein